MAVTEFYHYFPPNDEEARRYKKERIIESVNRQGAPNPRGTWWTPERYDYRDVARAELALDYLPEYRVGPIPSDRMPDFDKPLRPVAATAKQPGGGVEAHTMGKVFIFGLYNFSKKDWEM